MPESFTPQKPVLKKIFGILGIIVLILLGIFFLIFGGYVAYYLWIQKFGSPTVQKSLSEKFNPSFSKAPGLSGATTQTNEDVKSVLRPYNPTLGQPTAPITIVAFIDFECPYCQKSYPIFKKVIEKYGSTVRVIFKNFPIASIHPHAEVAALGGTCASEQGKFWPYYDAIFNTPNLSEEIVLAEANTLKLNSEKFSTCLTEQTHIQNIQDDLKDGISLGVEGTPTYFVNQQKVEGVLDLNQWDQVLLTEIQKKK